jgi:hypothetical protein
MVNFKCKTHVSFKYKINSFLTYSPGDTTWGITHNPDLSLETKPHKLRQNLDIINICV